MRLFCSLSCVSRSFTFLTEDWKSKKKNAFGQGCNQERGLHPLSAFSCRWVFVCDSFCLLNQDCIWPKHGQHLTARTGGISNTAKLRNTNMLPEFTSVLFQHRQFAGPSSAVLHMCCPSKTLKGNTLQMRHKVSFVFEASRSILSDISEPPSSSFLTFCSCCLLPPVFLCQIFFHKRHSSSLLIDPHKSKKCDATSGKIKKKWILLKHLEINHEVFGL